MIASLFTFVVILSGAFYMTANTAALRSLRAQRSPVVISKR